MSKIIKNTPFLRKIRRALAVNGYEAEVSWMPRPPYKNIMPSSIIQTKIQKNGEMFIAHHSAHSPATMDDFDRIMSSLLTYGPGASEASINKALHLTKFCNICDEISYPLIGCEYINASEKDYVINIPVSLINTIGDKEEKIVLFIADSDKPLSGWFKESISWSLEQVSKDRRRRDKKGNQKPLMIGGLLASFLRRHENGLIVTKDIIPTVAAVMKDYKADDDAVSVEKLKFSNINLGICYILKSQNINIEEYQAKGYGIIGDRIMFPGFAPATLLQSYSGRPLSCLVEGSPFPDCIIKSASYNKTKKSISVKLAVKPISIGDLIKELELENKQEAQI